MDRIKGTMKLPEIKKFKSMIYNRDELDTKIKQLATRKKNAQEVVKSIQSEINCYIEEDDKLKKEEKK